MKLSVESEWGEIQFIFSGGLSLPGWPSPTFDFLCSLDWERTAELVVENRLVIRKAYSEREKGDLDSEHFVQLLRDIFPKETFHDCGRDFDELLIAILESDEFSPLFKKDATSTRPTKKAASFSLEKRAQVDDIVAAVAFIEREATLSNEGIYALPFQAKNAPLLFSGKTFRLISGAQKTLTDESIALQILSFLTRHFTYDDTFIRFVEDTIEYQGPQDERPLDQVETKYYVRSLLHELEHSANHWTYPEGEQDKKTFAYCLGELHSILEYMSEDDSVDLKDRDSILWAEHACSDIYRATLESKPPSPFWIHHDGRICDLQKKAFESIRNTTSWTYEFTSIVELLFLMTSLSGQIGPGNGTTALRPCSCCGRPILSVNKNACCMRVFIDPETSAARDDHASCRDVEEEKREKGRMGAFPSYEQKEWYENAVRKNRQYNDNYQRSLKTMNRNLKKPDAAADKLKEWLLEYAHLYLYHSYYSKVYDRLMDARLFPPAKSEGGAILCFEDWHASIRSFKKDACRKLLKNAVGGKKAQTVSFDLVYPEVQLDSASVFWSARAYEIELPTSIFSIIERYVEDNKTQEAQREITTVIDKLDCADKAIEFLNKALPTARKAPSGEPAAALEPLHTNTHAVFTRGKDKEQER